MAKQSNGGDAPQGGNPSLVDSLEEYLKDIPKNKRADALHQVFYGFYTRVAVIDRGRIIVEGTPAELKARTNTNGLEDAFMAIVHGEGNVTEGAIR